MVAGEYAVLEPHQPLIVMAVRRYVYVTIEKSKTNELHLTDFDLMNISWTFEHDKIDINVDNKLTSFVKEALFIAYTYLKEKNIITHPTSITIKSDLQDDSGKKLGLGSSAAVVTAVISAILHMHLPEKPDKNLIFKLSAIAHLNVQKSGSGADIAASTFGGMVLYSSFQSDWLLDKYGKSSFLTDLLKESWPYLSIKKLNWPQQFLIRIGWTGTPASTRHLVEQVNCFKFKNIDQYNLFLNASKQAVRQMIRGIEQKDFTEFTKGVKKNREALVTLGRLADVKIETEKLKLLSDLAESFNGASKLSGAGGGDCGLAFLLSKNDEALLTKAWIEHEITPLSLTIDLAGSSLTTDHMLN